ncbi:hypothetical protein DFH06DRAFT_567048 [Mycena polygramma]|nr:hypothetical protein DFH06DRAFT_567048 [Mycena polygramma]
MTREGSIFAVHVPLHSTLSRTLTKLPHFNSILHMHAKFSTRLWLAYNRAVHRSLNSNFVPAQLDGVSKIFRGLRFRLRAWTAIRTCQQFNSTSSAFTYAFESELSTPGVRTLTSSLTTRGPFEHQAKSRCNSNSEPDFRVDLDDSALKTFHGSAYQTSTSHFRSFWRCCCPTDNITPSSSPRCVLARCEFNSWVDSLQISERKL